MKENTYLIFVVYVSADMVHTGGVQMQSNLETQVNEQMGQLVENSKSLVLNPLTL